jgi:hypothetical protein
MYVGRNIGSHHLKIIPFSCENEEEYVYCTLYPHDTEFQTLIERIESILKKSDLKCRVEILNEEESHLVENE